MLPPICSRHSIEMVEISPNAFICPPCESDWKDPLARLLDEMDRKNRLKRMAERTDKEAWKTTLPPQ